MGSWSLRILDAPKEMRAVEDLQRQVWTGSETEIVPAHVLISAVRNGGLVVGAYAERQQPFTGEQGRIDTDSLVGFVFGFPGFYRTPDGPRIKHYSHMLGVHPDFRNRGAGFALKRAQWQMVRKQGVDRITWTYDLLLSQNAQLNIARLGAVCNTYIRNLYGEMRDDLNAGLETDRFQVDWWVHSKRVAQRLSSKPRRPLDLAHFLAAEARIVNPTWLTKAGFPQPVPEGMVIALEEERQRRALLLVEIPPDFQTMRRADPELAKLWRAHTRALFEDLFARGYLVTDFVHLPGNDGVARSFYVLSHGESTL